MKNLFIAVCVLIITVQSFGQYSTTTHVINNAEPIAASIINISAPLPSEFLTNVVESTSPSAGLQSNSVKYSRDTIYTFKRQWPVYASFFGAGLAYGTAEGLIWHTNNSKNAFWNPYKSWKTGVAIDGYHAARAVGIACFITGTALSVNDIKHPFRWGMLKKVAIASVSYWAGQMITWHTVK